MGIATALGRFFGASASSVNGSAVNYRALTAARTTPVELPPAALYHLLRGAYLTNGWYDELRAAGFRVDGNSPQIKAIRNVVAPVVNFYGAKTFPEPLEIVTENERILEPIRSIWQWSNWRQNRRTFARMLALYGEVYLRCVASRERGRVHLEIVEPQYVTDFEDDERGYLTMIRLDTPQVEARADGSARHYTHTELWEGVSDDEPRGRWRAWDNDGDASARAVRDLGTPAEDEPLSAFGIDWLPFTRTEFSTIGEKRGIGAVQLALEAIVEADLNATNLHATLFQDLEGAWVLKSTGTDVAGRPLPPPVVRAAASTTDALGNVTTGNGRLADGTVHVGKRSFWPLGGGQELESVIPQIDYAAALAILQDHDAHLERLMPALTYTKISELSGGDLSGRAIRYKLTAAIDQVAEARGNALAGLRQAHMQALTLGQIVGAVDRGIGTYEGGDFAHEFADADILPTSGLEVAEEARTRAQAYQAAAGAGLPEALNLRLSYGMEGAALDEALALLAAAADGSQGEQEPMEGQER